MRKATANSGFTLLEILVALVVFGLLMVGLSHGVQFGLRARAMQARMLTQRAGLETTDRVLRALIEQIDPGSSERPSVIQGTAHMMTFPTILPNGADPLAEQPITAALLVDRAHRLMLRWVPRLHAVRLGAAPQPTETELLGDVSRIDIAYWQEAAGGEWLENWHNASPPALVRIRISFQAGDERHWPDIVVAPMRQSAGT
jgi:general secretion pathway protein J